MKLKLRLGNMNALNLLLKRYFKFMFVKGSLTWNSFYLMEEVFVPHGSTLISGVQHGGWYLNSIIKVMTYLLFTRAHVSRSCTNQS